MDERGPLNHTCFDCELSKGAALRSQRDRHVGKGGQCRLVGTVCGANPTAELATPGGVGDQLPDPRPAAGLSMSIAKSERGRQLMRPTFLPFRQSSRQAGRSLRATVLLRLGFSRSRAISLCVPFWLARSIVSKRERADWSWPRSYCRTGGSAIGLSATDACGRAFVGDDFRVCLRRNNGELKGIKATIIGYRATDSPLL